MINDKHVSADIMAAALRQADCISQPTQIEQLSRWQKGFNSGVDAQPDPLADAVESVLSGFEGRKHAESYANQIRAALEARGLEIRSKNDAQ